MKQKKTNKPVQASPRDLFIRRFRFIWKVSASLIILLWAGWCLLDAFVIPRDIVAAGEAATSDHSPEDPSPDDPSPEEAVESGVLTEPVITDDSYDDGRISIRIRTERRLNTTIYIADIELTDPGCLRTALANNSFGRNLTDVTSSMAEQNDAILAINGDYYGFRETGYVMRSGYLYRSDISKDPLQEDLVIYPDGKFEIVRESEITAKELAQRGATEIFSFGPGLIIDGETAVIADDEVERAQVTNPRTAIGVITPLHYVFLVSDGRTDESTGLSLLQLAEFMQELGCEQAYNLDGGGSSTIWFNGRVLNRPTTFGDKIEERSISDIVYIGQ